MIKWGLKKIIYGFIGAWLFIFLILQFWAAFFGLGSAGFWGATLLSFIIFFTLGAPFILMYILFWNILIKPGLLLAIYTPLVLIRLVAALFMMILRYLGSTAGAGLNFFQTAEENIRANKRKYGVLFGLNLVISFYFFLPRDLTSLISFITDATLISFVLIGIPVFVTALIAGFLGLRSGPSGESEEVEEAEADRRERMRKAASAGFDAGKEGAKLFDDITEVDSSGNLKIDSGVKKGAKKAAGQAAKKGRKFKAAGSKARVAGSSLSRGLLSAISRVPLFGRVAVWLSGLSGGTLILAIIAVIILLIIVWLIVMVAIWGLLAIIFGPYLGTVMGFANAQIGLGMDYGQWIGEEVGGEVPSYDFTGEMNALRMAWGRVECAMSGPQCLRELQANNTQRPGSESEGVRFGLEIEGFSVNNGYVFDIAGRKKNDNVPISFDVYNPVKNFKGIDAHNVQYRLTLDGGDTCIANGGEDSWGKLLGEGTIRAGTFERPTGELEDLTLENCELLQPALGIHRDATLQLLYDYSSQSTLQLEAMSEEYMMEEGLRSEPKKSVTANTPVQTFVNVQNPVLYQDQNGVREPDVFPVYVGFETEQYDIDYRIDIEELKLESSDALIDVDTANERYGTDYGGDCQALNHEGNGVYSINLSSSSAQNIQTQQENRWFSRGAGPSPFRCDMILDPGGSSTGPISSISPTGETLTMRVDANYTVRLSSQGRNFEAKNNRCTAGNFNCPLLVTEQETQDSTLRNTCDSSWRIDAAGGCSVVENQNDWGNPKAYNDENNYVNEVERGENVFSIGNLISKLGTTPTTFESDQFNDSAAIGVPEDKIESIYSMDTPQYLLINTGSSDNINVELQRLDYKLCDQDSDKVEKFLSSPRVAYGSAIFASIDTASCNGIFSRNCDSGEINAARSGNKVCLEP